MHDVKTYTEYRGAEFFKGFEIVGHLRKDGKNDNLEKYVQD